MFKMLRRLFSGGGNSCTIIGGRGNNVKQSINGNNQYQSSTSRHNFKIKNKNSYVTVKDGKISVDGLEVDVMNPKVIIIVEEGGSLNVDNAIVYDIHFNKGVTTEDSIIAYGDINIEGGVECHKIETTVGDVTISHANDISYIKTDSGEVNIKSMTGELRGVSTGIGDISISKGVKRK